MVDLKKVTFHCGIKCKNCSKGEGRRQKCLRRGFFVVFFDSVGFCYRLNDIFSSDYLLNGYEVREYFI